QRLSPARQTPAEQLSPPAQATLHPPQFRSSLTVSTHWLAQRVAPPGLPGLLHAPVAGLHVPARWHWSWASQMTGFAPTHAPAWQASARAQAFPSEHDVPSAAAGLLQEPEAGSHIPATWHWSWAAQVTGFAPTQAPAWQASVRVHAFPSVQAVPSG